MYTSTTTPLTSGSTWTGPPRLANSSDSIIGTVFADQAGTIFIEQSFDPNAIDALTAGTANWDVSTSYTITASDGKGFNEQVVAPIWRIRYVNGGTNQGAFRVYAKSGSAGER